MSKTFQTSMASPEELALYREYAKMQGFASVGAMARYSLQQYADRYKLEEKLQRRFAVQRAGISEEAGGRK